MMLSGQMLCLPDILADWPWKREINPLYEEVQAESDAWVKSFNAFTPRSQYAFDKGDFGLSKTIFPHLCPS